MSKLSNERLAEIRAADAARTPGEWTPVPYETGNDGVLIRGDKVYGEGYEPGYDNICYIATPYGRQHFANGERCHELKDANAAFIAACSTAVPDLLAHIDALYVDIQRLKTALYMLRRGDLAHAALAEEGGTER